MSSHELEVELEAQLEQTEAKNKELRSANYRLQMDLQSLRVGVVVPLMGDFSCHQGVMQDQIIASHTCFGGHMDVNC